VEEARALADAVTSDKSFVEFRHPRVGGRRGRGARADDPHEDVDARVKAILAELSAEGRIAEISRGLWMHGETSAALQARILETLAEFSPREAESPGMPAPSCSPRSSATRRRAPPRSPR